MSKNGAKQAKKKTVGVGRAVKSGILHLRRFWQTLDQSYRRSIVYALLLHFGILVLLGSGWSSQAEVRPVVAPRHINAVVVDASVLDEKKQKKAAVEQKKKTDQKKKIEEEKKKQRDKKKALERKKKAEQKKKAEAKKQLEKKKALAKKKALEKKKKEDARKKALAKKKEEEKKREQKRRQEEQKKKQAEAERIKAEKLKKEKARQQALQREQQEAKLQEMMLKAEQERQQQLDEIRRQQEQIKADQIAEMNEVDRFIALIRAKITRNWHKPPSAKRGETVVLQLHLFPTGELDRATILKSSGDSHFDRSALSAATSISRYPVPSDNGVFERNFRRFSMSFSHQED